MAEQSLIKIYFDLDPTGAPIWSADPELDKIPWGTAALLLWQLIPGSGAPGAAFPPKRGIYFESSAAYPETWPNPQPAPVPTPLDVPTTQYEAKDPNFGKQSEPIRYKYMVTVVANDHTYDWDPEIENEDGG
jgi:hypothetical protein